MATKTEDQTKDGEATEGKAKGGKLKLILMVLPTLLLIGVLAWFLFLKPAPEAAAPKEEPKPEAGPVVVLEPVTINLASGHYLKLGMTLQATAEVTEELDGSKALDAAIALYSGMAIEEIASTEGRDKTKKELIEKIGKVYEDKVYDIYYTTFVYQ